MPGTDELTELLLAAQDGDRLALSAWIRRSQAEVWRLCAQLVSREQADDVTQEVYLRAYRALPAFRGDSSARTWLLAIARRTCADAVRDLRRRRRLAARFERPGYEPDPAGAISVAQNSPPKSEPPAQPAATDAKPLSDVVKKGLAFLVAQQLPNGGWIGRHLGIDVVYHDLQELDEAAPFDVFKAGLTAEAGEDQTLA